MDIGGALRKLITAMEDDILDMNSLINAWIIQHLNAFFYNQRIIRPTEMER